MTDETADDEDSTERTESLADADVTIEYDWTATGRPSLAVVEAVAATTGREPADLPPLQRFVDAGALDTLLTDASARSRAVTASFSYDGYEVVVDGHGAVRLTIESSGEQPK